MTMMNNEFNLIDEHGLRLNSAKWVPYYLIHNAAIGCGMPLHYCFHEKYGKTMYLYWKERFEVQGVEFNYSESDFTYSEMKVGANKKIILFMFPTPKKNGEPIAVAILMDMEKDLFAKVDIVLFNGKYRIISKDNYSGVTFIFGEISTNKRINEVSGLFDTIINLSNSMRSIGLRKRCDDEEKCL